jgi:hypothetical protein
MVLHGYEGYSPRSMYPLHLYQRIFPTCSLATMKNEPSPEGYCKRGTP